MNKNILTLFQFSVASMLKLDFLSLGYISFYSEGLIGLKELIKIILSYFIKASPFLVLNLVLK